jgi:hypothetical protein
MTPKLQRRVFLVVVLVSLGLAALFGLIVAQPVLIGGLAGDPSGGHIGEHFRQPHHRIHDLAFGLLLGTTAVGMLAQVRAPAQNVAGQLMAATPILALLLAALATDPRVLSIPWVAVGAPTIVATMLHPHLFRSVGTARPSRPMIVVAAIAAVPLLAYALSNIGLQRSGPGDHAALGHYGYMAAFAFTIFGAGPRVESAARGLESRGLGRGGARGPARRLFARIPRCRRDPRYVLGACGDRVGRRIRHGGRDRPSSRPRRALARRLPGRDLRRITRGVLIERPLAS